MGHSESCFLSEKKSRLPHLSRLPLRYLQTVAFSLTCRCRNWASRGSEHRGPPACGSGGCDTKLSFIHQLYFSIQKEELLLKWKAKVLFLLFFSRHGYTHTHTHRGLQAIQSSSWNFSLNTSKQGLRKQLIMTVNGADCQGKQIFWTFLKQYLILHSPCLLLVLLSCCVRT